MDAGIYKFRLWMLLSVLPFLCASNLQAQTRQMKKADTAYKYPLVYDIYNIAFVNTPKYGYASAVAMVLFAMVLIITLIQFKGSSNDN